MLPRSATRRLIYPAQRLFCRQWANSLSTIAQADLAYAVGHVQDHDPSGYLPGRLLPTETMQHAYYAVRNFWVETGLRFGSTAKVPLNAGPEQHLEYWQQGIDVLFDDDAEIEQSLRWNHPALRLLQSLLRDEKLPWKKTDFNVILEGRRKDLTVKQYDTLDDLVHHAEQSCGHLNRLVLQSGHVDATKNPQAYEAARLVGIAHGITNALRTSIPVISTTGKLVVPAELTVKHGVKSPRYLLSALSQGDATCERALQLAVQDVADAARSHLGQARALRPSILEEPDHDTSLPVLLPGLAAETFLDRLAEKQYQLTNRELRNVGWVERGICSGRMVLASYQQTY